MSALQRGRCCTCAAAAENVECALVKLGKEGVMVADGW